jgi:ACR3 family arsenite efflux pump ArsB
MASQERFMAVMLNVVPSIIVVVAMFEVDFTDERAVQISFPNHFPKVDSKFD